MRSGQSLRTCRCAAPTDANANRRHRPRAPSGERICLKARQVHTAERNELRLARERVRIGRDQLDQIGLAFGASFFENMMQVALDRLFRDTQYRRDFRNAADFYDREQEP
jgi:hypothetical protein